MAVRVITAPPGKGKTLNMTRLAIKEFNEINSFIYKIKAKIEKKEFIYYNNIYSNYPILLHYQKKPFKIKLPNGNIVNSIPIKKTYDNITQDKYYAKCEEKDREYYGIFSNFIKLTDMHIEYDLGNNISIFIDEIQYTYDSQEYKDFPDCIAHFFQAHRHLMVNNIYTNSQSLTRVIKRVLCVSEEYWNILKCKKLFFGLLPIIYVKYIIRTDISTGKENENQEIINEENKNIMWDLYTTKVYKSYNTKYLCELKKDLPKYPNKVYTSLKLPKNTIINGFLVSEEEKQNLKNIRF